MADEPKPMSDFQFRIIKWLTPLFSRWNARRHLASDGRSMGKIAGSDICVATLTGAKSGQRRDVPLMYVPSRDGVILVASLGGADVRVKDKTLSLRARLASPSEKAAVWPTCVEHYPDYANYQARTPRDIPVFICEPRA